MSSKTLIAITLALIGNLTVLLFGNQISQPVHKVELSIEGVRKLSDGRTVITAHTYVAPEMQFVLESGTRPLIKDVLFCTEDDTQKDFGDHTDTFISFSCESGAKLTLHAIEFTH